MTALTLAANYGKVELIRELLNVPGIDVNAKDHNGCTALILAANDGKVEVVRELLDVPGIEVNAKDDAGWTALIEAVFKGHVEVVRELLKVPGIDVNVRAQSSDWPALIGTAFNIVRVLLKVLGININASDEYGNTALMWAANRGNVEVVKELLKIPEIDVNAKNTYGETVLMWAANKGNVEVVRELLKIPEIDINAKNNHGHSALYLAIEKSVEQNAFLLWAVGAQDEGLPALAPHLIITDLQGNNPLHIAVIRNRWSHAKYLIAYNKQWLRDKNKDGLSPLDLIYGHWCEENDQWNALIAELPGEFMSHVEKAKRDWQVFKDKAFREGYEGMPGLPSEKEK